MPLWAFIPLILVAVFACPVSMWVMGKVTKRNLSCAMCLPGKGERHEHSVQDLETRKAALEREIHALEIEIGQGQVRAGERR